MAKDYLDHLHSVARATSQYLIVWTALFVWDTLSTLKAESNVLWRREWTAIKVLYLLNRYGVLLLETASATVILTPMSHRICQRVYWIQPVNIVIVIFVCQSIMSIRIFAIFERGRAIGFFLLSLVLFETVGAVAAATKIVPLDLSKVLAERLELQGCLVVAKPGQEGKIFLILVISPFVFDTIILALATYRSISLHRKFRVKMPLLETIVRDGLLYYLGMTVTHTVTVVLWFQNDIAVKSFNVPSSIVVPSIMCSRLILSLLLTSAKGPDIKPLSLVTSDQGARNGFQLNQAVEPLLPDRDSHAIDSYAVDHKVDPQREGGTSDLFELGKASLASLPNPLSLTLRPALCRHLSNPSLLRPPKSPLRPTLSSRPSLASWKSDVTIESIISRNKSPLSTSTSTDPPVLGIQVTKEVVVEVAPIEDPVALGLMTTTDGKKRSLTHPKEHLYPTFENSSNQKRLTFPVDFGETL